jgi:hypothetical protein
MIILKTRTAIIAIMILTYVLLFTLLSPLLVAAQTQSNEVDIQGGLCSGASFELNLDCQIDRLQASEQLSFYISQAINIFSVVVGIMAVVMIIIGGVKYITSGGDAGNVTGAKNTILYAIIGLVVVALSQVIVQFVLGSFNQ